jgi:hypothetical protein
MNKIVRKIQQATEKAEEIRRVVEGVPPKIAQVKQAIAATAGEVQKLRGDVMSTVGTLRVENDTQVLEALREIDAHLDVLGEAGCHVERVDMDLGPTRRLVVHLARQSDVSVSELRALQIEHKDLATIRALLGAIIKADELAETVDLNELEYTRLTVDLGLISTVRMGWRMHEADASLPLSMPIAAAVASARSSGPEHVVPTFQQSTYFAPRTTAADAVAPATTGTAGVLAHFVGSECSTRGRLAQDGARPVQEDAGFEAVSGTSVTPR